MASKRRTLALKVEAEISGLDRIDKLGDRISDFGKKMTKMVTLPLVAGGVAAFKFASDLDEATSKAAQVFEGETERIRKAAGSMDDAFSEATFLDTAGTFGALLTQMGFVEKEAGDLSLKWLDLAQDMASFHNTNPDEALGAIQSALAGEFEPLKRYGVILNETVVKQKAMEMGLYDGVGAISAQARALVVNEELFARQGKVIGDFERTQGGAANSTRILLANFIDTAAVLGKELLPFGTELLTTLNGWVKGFKNLDPETRTWIVRLAAIAAAAGPVLFVFGKLLSSIKLFVGAGKLVIGAWRNIPTALGFVDLAISKIGPAFAGAATAARTFASLLLGPIGIAVAAFTAGFATDFLGMRTRFEKDMGDIGNFLGDAGDAFRDFFGIVEKSPVVAMLESEKEGWAAYEERIDSTINAAGEIVETGVDGMASDMGELPGKMADELLAAQFSLTDATTQLVEFMEQALTPAQEMFQARGFLMSSELAAGLASNNPLVRLKAEELRDVALETLGQGDASAGGAALIKSWINGMGSGWDVGINRVRAIVTSAGRILGRSLPTEGPLAGGVASGGYSVIESWFSDMDRAARRGMGTLTGIAAAGAAMLAGSAIGLPGIGSMRPAAVSVGAGGGGGTTINNFYLQWDGESPKGRTEAEIVANLQRLSPLIGGKLAAGY